MKYQTIVHLAKMISLVLCTVVLCYILGFGISFLCQKGYQFCYKMFGNPVVKEQDVKSCYLAVEDDDTIGTVAEKLEKKRIIDNPYGFYIRSKLMNANEIVLQPGIYRIYSTMNYEQIIDEITKMK